MPTTDHIRERYNQKKNKKRKTKKQQQTNILCYAKNLY